MRKTSVGASNRSYCGIERGRIPSPIPWSERDAWLITYADQFREPGEQPLRTLNRFLANHLDPWLNGVHVLPFFPWSSDDGFSVTDYAAVDPDYGNWAAVEDPSQGRKLVVEIDGRLTGEVVEAAASWLANPTESGKATDVIFEIGRGYFSYGVLQRRLLPLFDHN